MKWSGVPAAILRRHVVTTALASALSGAILGCGTGGDLRPVARGPFVDGVRHGLWRIVHPNGYIEEGRYLAGRLHGEWVLYGAGDAVIAREFWCHGRAVEPTVATCE